MFERAELSILKSRLAEPRRFLQVLLGPRQVGKTTLARQALAPFSGMSFFHSADDSGASGAAWIRNIWEAARLQMRSAGATEAILVIDEIQKIDNWSETVKAEWDRDASSGLELKVVLLGSARLQIQKGLTESLAGRFEVIPLAHWSFSEMEAAFGFSAEKFAWFGGYPGAASLIDDEVRWKNYVLESIIETTVSRDVLMLARIDKPALLRRLFELGVDYSGQIVSLTKMLGQLQDSGNMATMANYATLLDAAGLLTTLDNFRREAVASRASIPKWQARDASFLSARAGFSFAEARLMPEKWGRWVESAVGSHLLAAASRRECRVFYWRDRDQEVDFVIERGGKIIGLEVKSGHQPPSRGLAGFEKAYSPDKVLLIGERGLPWQQFLKMPVIDLF